MLGVSKLIEQHQDMVNMMASTAGRLKEATVWDVM